MSIFRNAWAWLNNEPHQLIGIRVLQMCIGAALLFTLFTELPFASFLWGPHGIGWGSTSSALGSVLQTAFDALFATNAGVFCVLFVLGLGALGLVSGYATRIATFLTLIAFSLLIQRLPELGDSGDNMAKIVLIYMCFLLPRRTQSSAGEFRVWLHNLAVLAIALQLMVMYLTSGFAKAMGETWQNGVAMYYVNQIQWFTLPGTQTLFLNPFIVTAATYIPMFYQLLFPVAVISRIKLPWILLGILFHLGIAVLMGLISFSTIMIGLELFLISDEEYIMLWRGISRIWRRVSPSPLLFFSTKVRRFFPLSRI